MAGATESTIGGRMRKFITRATEAFNFVDVDVSASKWAEMDDLVGIYVRIPLEMKKVLRDEAESTGNSMSALVRHALRSIYKSTNN